MPVRVMYAMIVNIGCACVRVLVFPCGRTSRSRRRFQGPNVFLRTDLDCAEQTLFVNHIGPPNEKLKPRHDVQGKQ